MSGALTMSDFLAMWAAKLQAAADVHPAVTFDGRIAMPAWLLDAAKEQADHVFLILDGTPVERRDLGEAERLIQNAGLEFLLAWGNVMAAFRSDREPWAKDAADAAARAYNNHLNELAPTLHAGGVA